MLYLMYFCLNLVTVIAMIFKSTLTKYYATVNRQINQMYSNAKDLYTKVERIINGMCAFERREQCRVDIQYLAFVRIIQYIPHYSHITGKADEVYLLFVQDTQQTFFVFRFRAALLW